MSKLKKKTTPQKGSKFKKVTMDIAKTNTLFKAI